MKRDFLSPWLMTVAEVAHGSAKRIDSTICLTSLFSLALASSLVAAAMTRRVPPTATIQTRIVAPAGVVGHNEPPKTPFTRWRTRGHSRRSCGR